MSAEFGPRRRATLAAAAFVLLGAIGTFALRTPADQPLIGMVRAEIAALTAAWNQVMPYKTLVVELPV